MTCNHANVNLEFTPQERKMIERLRTQERLWPRLRWFCLVAGTLALVNVGMWGYMLLALLHNLGDSKPDYVAMVNASLIFPKVLIHIGIATWCITIAIRDWHGNVNRMLLLRLLDAQKQVE